MINNLTLTAAESAMLAGAEGPGAAFAMNLLARFATAVGAPSFLPCTSAHIDGCLHHGQVSLDFVEHLITLGAKVRVPTSLNVGSMDLIHPELFLGTEREASDGTRLMRAHEDLGCLPSFTCAPYQAGYRPRKGEQIAWAESNAIVFANSVLGARTNRYGDFLDLACAITGRVPHYGLHRTENRKATVEVALDITPALWPDRSLLAVAVGYALGRDCGDSIAAITGLPADVTEDDLKALGAVAASSGAVALFHAVGLTPEAPDLSSATQGEAVTTVMRYDDADLMAIVRALSTVKEGAPLVAVALGTPHFSITEFERLMPLLEHGPPIIDTYINTSRFVLAALEKRGWDKTIREAGIILVIDTCTYVTSIMRNLNGAVMTNSGKWAHYAPGNLKIDVAFGSLADCMASARLGRLVHA